MNNQKRATLMELLWLMFLAFVSIAATVLTYVCIMFVIGAMLGAVAAGVYLTFKSLMFLAGGSW